MHSPSVKPVVANGIFGKMRSLAYVLSLISCCQLVACGSDDSSGGSGGSGASSTGGAGSGGGGTSGSGGSSSGGSGGTGGGVVPAPGAGERLFVPEIVADDGSQKIWNYRQKSTPFWFGKVDSKNNYTDCRAGYDAHRLMVRCAVFDQKIYDAATDDALENWDSLTLLLDLDGAKSDKALDARSLRIDAQAKRQGAERSVVYRGGAGAWTKDSASTGTDPSAGADGIVLEKGYRGEAADKSRGWHVTFFVGWKALGLSAPPLDSDAARSLRLAVVSYDRDDAGGSVHGETVRWPSQSVALDQPKTWGMVELLPTHYASWAESGSATGAGKPAYAIGYAPEAFATGTEATTSIRHGLAGAVVENASVGASGTLCSGNDGYNFGDGAASYGGNTERNYFHVQNQEDYADWPCFSKIYLKFPLGQLATGKVVVKATLVMHHKEPTSGGPEGERSLIQAFPVANLLRSGAPWTEQNITWNDAPFPFENAAGAWGDRTGNVQTGWDKLPEWSFDVSRAFARIYAAGDASASFALYSADGEYHTGKQFVNSSDFPDWGDPNQRPRLDVTLADPK